MNLDIKKRIDAIADPEAITFFFNLLKSLIKEGNISESDKRLAINVRNDHRKRFSVNLNGRKVLLISEGNVFGLMINNDDIAKISELPILKTEAFDKLSPHASLVFLDFAVLKEYQEKLKLFWLNSCLVYLPVQKASQYRRFHIDELYKLAVDDELLKYYLANTSVVKLNFPMLIDEFRQYLKGESAIINEFEVREVEKNTKWAWIWDNQKVIGDALAHYELREEKSKIYVDIHFESLIQEEKDIFYKSISDLPQEIKLIPWQSSQSFRYFEGYDINDPDILAKLAKALLYLEQNVGDRIRKIKTEMENTTGSNNGGEYKKYPLNQILYGPPGTGKTYHTINKALSIIEDKLESDLELEDRKILKARFENYVKVGQIVFTTFHQSMSYEDFIEGIKPLEPNSELNTTNELIYKTIPGVFKALCTKANASSAIVAEVNKNEIELNSEVLAAAYKTYAENLPNQREISSKYVLYTKSDKTPFYLYKNSAGSIVVKGGKGQSPMPVALSEIENVLLNNKKPTYPSYAPVIIEGIKEILKLNGFDEKKIENQSKNYVLIIDEINRGNVSQIFGELITLIEEDKRLGKDEALEVTLPYSKERFGVPPNLYIIGTMNTADRSVEALDTALRRRFSFEEMPSKPSLIKTAGLAKANDGDVGGINLVTVLETINSRIEILSNRDHKIGHAYFLKVTTLEELKETFKKNIIPLLQEYFYNDYEKMGWVIGEGFFEEKRVDKKGIFTTFFKESKPDFEVAYQLKEQDSSHKCNFLRI